MQYICLCCIELCKCWLYDVAMGSDESKCAVDVLQKFDWDIDTRVVNPIDSMSSCHRLFGYKASKQAGKLFKLKYRKPILTSNLVSKQIIKEDKQITHLFFKQRNKQKQSNRLVSIVGSGVARKFFVHVSTLEFP